jgi:hypothetical protein
MLAAAGRLQIADPFRMAHVSATRRVLSASITGRRWSQRIGVRGDFPFLLVSPGKR